MKKILGIGVLIVITLGLIGFVIAQTNKQLYSDDYGVSNDTTNAGEPMQPGDVGGMSQRDMMMHVGMLVAQSDEMYGEWYQIYTNFDEMMGINDPEELHQAMEDHRAMMEDFNRRATELHLQYQALVQSAHGNDPNATSRPRGMDGFPADETDQHPDDAIEGDTSTVSDTTGMTGRGADTLGSEADHQPAIDTLEDATEDTMEQDTIDY